MKKLEWLVSLAFMTAGCASQEAPAQEAQTTKTAKTTAAMAEDCYACEPGAPPPVSSGGSWSPAASAGESTGDFYDRCPTVSSESFELCPGVAYVRETKCCGDECQTYNMGAQEAIDRCLAQGPMGS